YTTLLAEELFKVTGLTDLSVHDRRPILDESKKFEGLIWNLDKGDPPPAQNLYVDGNYIHDDPTLEYNEVEVTGILTINESFSARGTVKAKGIDGTLSTIGQF